MESLRKMFMDSGIILAVLTVLSYFTAFFHQYGYIGFYGIFNTNFIEIGLVNILSSFKSVLIMIFIILTLYQVLLQTSLFFKPSSIFGYGFLSYVIPWVMISFIISIMFSATVHPLKVFGFIVLFGIFVTYLPDFESFKKGKNHGYKEMLRLKFERNQNDVFNYENLKSKIRETPLLIFVFSLSFLLFSQCFSTYLGNSEAQKQEHYLILEINSKDFIIVKKFADHKALLVAVDMKKKKLKNETMLSDLVSVKEGEMKQVYIDGGLHSNYNSLLMFPLFN